MPITLPGMLGTILPAITAAGMIGTSAVQLATAVASGIVLWNPTIKIVSVDVGVLGVGAGTGPIVVPPPALLGALTTTMAASGIIGTMAIPLATGLSTGIALGYASGLIVTVNTGVGVGSGVAKVIPPPAVPQMIAGFAAAGLTGTSVVQLATAIGLALPIAFAPLVSTIVIVGSPSILPGVGAGIGQIV